MSLDLAAAASCWGSAGFEAALRHSLVTLPAGSLPLQAAATQGGMVDDSRIVVTLLACSDTGDRLRATIDVLFDEIVGGCSCHDGPVATNNRCALLLDIDKVSGVADCTLLDD